MSSRTHPIPEPIYIEHIVAAAYDRASHRRSPIRNLVEVAAGSHPRILDALHAADDRLAELARHTEDPVARFERLTGRRLGPC